MSFTQTSRLFVVLAGALLVSQGCGGAALKRKTVAGDAGPTGGSLATAGATAVGGTGGSGGMGGAGTLTTGGTIATGGTLTTGGTVGTGGTVATGGTVGTGGTVATGGITGSGGTVATGGTTGSGGTRIATGGSEGSGGCPCTGGSSGTGGTRGGTGGAQSTGGAGGNVLDGGACTCSGMSFDCFCTIHPCSQTLSYYTVDAGAGGRYSVLEEYANCNLVVVAMQTGLGGWVYVFDRTTGRLVGETYETDVPETCPFAPDAGQYLTLTAGRFPDATCVRSKCSNGSYPASTPCPDAGI